MTGDKPLLPEGWAAFVHPTDRTNELLHAQSCIEIIDAAYIVCCSSISTTSYYGVERYEGDAKKIIDDGLTAAKRVYSSSRGLAFNQEGIHNLILQFSGISNGVKEHIRRLEAVEREETKFGSAALPVGCEVFYVPMRRWGLINSVSQGFKGRPYYMIALHDRHGKPSVDPSDTIFAYIRELDFAKSLLNGGKNGK